MDIGLTTPTCRVKTDETNKDKECDVGENNEEINIHPTISPNETVSISPLLHSEGRDVQSLLKASSNNINPAVLKNVDKNSTDVGSYISYANPGSYSHEYSIPGMDSNTFSDQPLLRNPSSLLIELGRKLSFTKNPSNTYNRGLLTFSRNPSSESIFFPTDIMNRNPSFSLENDTNQNAYDPFNLSPPELSRNNSLKLESLHLLDLKRQSSNSVQDPTKFARQNTLSNYGQLPIPANTQLVSPSIPMIPANMHMISPTIHMISPTVQMVSPTIHSGQPMPFIPPQQPAQVTQPVPIKPISNHPESNDGKTHRILTAQIGGVNYTGEIKKKDKKDPHKWTQEEDELLKAAVKEFGERQWKDIASRIPGRNHVQCLQRWKKVLKPGLKKGHWTEEEDNLLRYYKSKTCNWSEIAEKIQGRTAKQCRERWCNHINPEIRKGGWTEEEDRLIISLQKEWGNRWSSIAQNLPGRSENSVKIRWKTLNRHGKRDHHSAPQQQVIGVLPLQPPVTMNSQYAAGIIPNQPSAAMTYQVPINDLSAGVSSNPPYVPAPSSVMKLPSIPLYTQGLESVYPSIVTGMSNIPQSDHISKLNDPYGNQASQINELPSLG